ncbi:sulfur carrier protein ThiS [Desulfobotulus sp. H1]|uniref:Sulfur carrier protein ThiS n=1 Tax=Desulfobotulus pelophilus TaxID=2823377 RepID=A0ABT3NBW5_9BACT|nr:sulfur carrier protein ThiS [Desulfobotulus pelophilus]MCW7754962.1 sulfur carrier protein ThiS [Desulfobotulus pelophilus]
MQIIVNGREEMMEKKTDILALLQSKKLKPDTVVVELNGLIIEKKRFSETFLNSRDQVEILRFVGGG